MFSVSQGVKSEEETLSGITWRRGRRLLESNWSSRAGQEGSVCLCCVLCVCVCVCVCVCMCVCACVCVCVGSCLATKVFANLPAMFITGLLFLFYDPPPSHSWQIAYKTLVAKQHTYTHIQTSIVPMILCLIMKPLHTRKRFPLHVYALPLLDLHVHVSIQTYGTS